MSTVAHPRITPEELSWLPDRKRYELMDGELMEKARNFQSAWVAAHFCAQLIGFVEPLGLGFVFGGGLGYQCFPGDNVRRPDASFIRAGRLTLTQFEAEHCTVVPDCVLEIVSPGDLSDDVERKAKEYLSAGVHLVWVLNPETQTILVYRPDGSMAHLSSKNELDGESVLPGFKCPVKSLFPDKVQLGLMPT